MALDELDSVDDGDDSSGDEGALSRQEILDHAIRILGEMQEQGVRTMGVRQMYYQFVGAGLLVEPVSVIGNGDAAAKWWNRQYKRIGNVLSEARYMREFPIDGIVDEGREVHHGDFTRDVKSWEVDHFESEALAIRKAIPDFLIRRARWHGQRTHLSVWVEKQGLEGIFGQVTRPAGVGLFACKGYPSVSALYDWLRHAYFAVHGEHSESTYALDEQRTYTYGNGFDWTEFHRGTAEECVILYCGDHDPDGFEIPRAAERGLRTLMDNYGLDVPLRVERIALNMDQIATYNPPPFRAKKSSARYKKYRAEHGIDDAWELDALNPVVLRDLIRANIQRFFVQDTHRANIAEIAEFRTRLRAVIGLDEDGDEVEERDEDDDFGGDE